MSGLLRRIKRSRPADAGEPLTEGQAAAPDGAPNPADAPVFRPAPAPDQPGFGPATDPAAAPGRAAATGPAAPAPVLLADPNTPAGIDPAEAPLRPPAGRRGRLRRRLRYLRRARELMLRDLGGLFYEIHRTGGGNVEAHAMVVGAKVQRIAGLDAEAHALETALAAPRSEAVLFQPGIGGACATCGELYGSAAQFCSNCGAALGAAPPARPAAPGAEAPTSDASETPARRSFWRRGRRAEAAGGEPAAVPSDDEATVAAPDETQRGQSPLRQGSTDADTAVLAPGEQPAAESDETAPPEARDEPPADATAEPASTDPAPSDAPAGEEPGNPYSGLGNGRTEGQAPPDLSSGDPLVSKERG